MKLDYTKTLIEIYEEVMNRLKPDTKGYLDAIQQDYRVKSSYNIFLTMILNSPLLHSKI